MMTWNHRVMRGVAYGETFFSIREVFYDDDGTVQNWTADPIDPYGETLDELKTCLEQMLAACDQPVLDAETGEEIA